MAGAEKIEGKEASAGRQQVVTAVYKLNLHCQQCANAIQKNLNKTEGVREVDVEEESGKITVKGKIDPVKIHEQMEKSSRRKVELISPLPKKPEPPKVEKKVEKKQVVVKTTVLKMDMHCANCESHLKKKMLELEGVYEVKINRERQTCTVEGAIEPEKLIKYLRRKLHKQVDIVQQKEEEGEEEKGEKKGKEVQGKGSKEGVSAKKDKAKMEIRRVETKAVEYKLVPYYVYRDYGTPDMFSDENPNSCIIS